MAVQLLVLEHASYKTLSHQGVVPVAEPPLTEVFVVSVYPCAVHGARTKEPLNGLRITVLSAGDKYTRYLRVCSPDLEEILTAHSDEWLLVDDAGLDGDPTMCGACGTANGSFALRCHLFAYVFRKGSERQDYYAQYCDSCAEGVRDTFGLERELA